MKKMFFAAAAVFGMLEFASAQSVAGKDNCTEVNAIIKDLNDNDLKNFKAAEGAKGSFKSKTPLNGFSENEINFSSFSKDYIAKTSKASDKAGLEKTYADVIAKMKKCLPNFTPAETVDEYQVQTIFSSDATKVRVFVMYLPTGKDKSVTVDIQKENPL